MSRHSLAVRLDALGDMLVCGPAIRAIAAGSDRLTVLAGPAGAPAARLLPGVDEVLTWACPWIAADPPPLERADVDAIVERIRPLEADTAVILTSFHQSALPTALLLRLAGVRRICAVSEDYPGALLDVRLPDPPDGPEPERMLAIARGAGFDLPPGDDGALRLTGLDPHPLGRGGKQYVVVHPGVTAPARSYPEGHWRQVVELLVAAGWPVLVTGSRDEARFDRRRRRRRRAPRA